MLILSKKIFENTTQWAITAMRFLPMRKCFKSNRFPAFNIPRRNEAVAITDTIFSHAPAMNFGVTMAQNLCWQRFPGLSSCLHHTILQAVCCQYLLEFNIRFSGSYE